MGRFDGLSIEELTRAGGFDCDCGRKHETGLQFIRIGHGALAAVPEAVTALGAKRPFVVADQSTWKAAGMRVDEILTGAGIAHTCFVIPDAHPEPDERALGAIAMNFDPTCDLVLGVGSGVVNDLCKVFAFDTGRVQMIVGTAPSMDGYASNSSSMLVHSVKLTLYNRCPAAIVLDTEILAHAPMRMLQAGLGDMAAKYISVCEWRIAHIVTGEYYCEEVAQLMRRSVKKIMAAAGRLAARDESAIGDIAEGLVMSGIAMSFAKVSRPASGLEHYFSHMWEMMALERGQTADLHGIQVGVGTCMTLKMYDRIRTLTPDPVRARAFVAHFDGVKWADNVRRVFGKTAPEILALEEKAHKNDPVRHAARLEKICAHWNEILQIIDAELPRTDDFLRTVGPTGMPLTREELGISRADAVDAFFCSRDIRDKYLTSSLLWDLGVIDEYAERIE